MVLNFITKRHSSRVLYSNPYEHSEIGTHAAFFLNMRSLDGFELETPVTDVEEIERLSHYHKEI